MPPLSLVYHPGYDLRIGKHVFPAAKFRMIRDQLAGEPFCEPAPATDEQILRVHDPEWVAKLKECRLSYREMARMEIPWSAETAKAVWLATGGTVLAAQRAVESGGIGFNFSGGFHHAFRAHGEGFCAINDIAVAIRTVGVRSVVIDCDVHHGNGTAAIFAGDPLVATLSIHQLNNYPSEKPASTLDIDLADGTGDEEYLAALRAGVEQVLGSFGAELVVYVAGADPYFDDQLGGLALTMEGLRQRDRFVLTAARSRGIPVAIVLAGGYARSTDDTVTIHCNTVEEAKRAAAL